MYDARKPKDSAQIELPKRRSIRLKDFDYSQAGAYFITICTQDRVFYFEQYPELKAIVTSQWRLLPQRFPRVVPDEFVVMPNHVHGIVFLRDDTAGATLAVARTTAECVPTTRAAARAAPTVGQIVGAYKSLSVNKWLRYLKESRLPASGEFWQRNYYEHVIRDEHDLHNGRQYIINNPKGWDYDRENPAATEFDPFEQRIFATER